MDKLVYGLCTITSLTCAVLLLRGYLRGKSRLLLWTGVCFVTLSVSNGLLYVDQVLIPTGDLSLVRSFSTLTAASLLLGGIIWETN